MAQANHYFAPDIDTAGVAIDTMGALQQQQLQRQQAQQQQAEFQQGQEKDALLKNALVQFLGPVNAGMVTGDAGMTPQGQQSAVPMQGQPNTLAGGGPQPAQGDPRAQQNSLAQIMYANPALGAQIMQQQAQQQQFAQEQALAQAKVQKEAYQQQAKQKLLEVRYFKRMPNPGKALEMGHTEAYDNMVKQGVDMTDPDAVRGALDRAEAHLGSIAGEAPEKEEDSAISLAEGAQLVDKKTGRKIAENVKDRTADNQAQNQRLFERANKLRDEYNAQTKDFSAVQSQYDNIVSTSAKPSAAGDISLIFSYMKMLDPASTVREGEFATAQNSGSAFNRVGALYNKVMKGERLTTDQRSDFVGQAGNIFKSRAGQKAKVTKKYSEFAQRTGVDPLDVVGAPEDAAAPAAGGGGLPDGWSVQEH